LSSSRYRANSGAGAALHGGRWNASGIPAIYCAENRSLAALEILVHYAVQPRDFVMTAIDFAADLVTEVGSLPPGWETDLNLTRRIGAEWHDSSRSAVLRVPSSVEPKEWNFVINPIIPTFRALPSGLQSRIASTLA
jgi:RES domain-containing protein